MRSAFLFPVSLSLVVVAGCSSKVEEHAARSDLERDLTLVGQAPETAVATPLELTQIRTTDNRSTVSSRHRVRHRSAPRSTVRTPKPVQVVAYAAPAPAPAVVQPTATGDPHELLPGKTVTIIPVSSGPSTAEPRDDRFSPRGYGGTGGSGMGGGERAGGGSGMGGDCPRPDFGPTGVRGGTRGLSYYRIR